MITDILKKMLQSVYSIRKRALFTGALVPLKAHVRVFVLLRRSNRYPKPVRESPGQQQKSSSPQKRSWVQWRCQHPNETRSIPLWLVILDSWLVGLLASLLDFEDLRSSVQPFAAGSTPPLWPAWQNSQEKAQQSWVSAPWFISCALALCCLSCRPFGKAPNSGAISNFLSYWTVKLCTISCYLAALYCKIMHMTKSSLPYEPFHLIISTKWLDQPHPCRNPRQLQHWLRYLDDFGYLDACLLFPLQPVNNVCH